jgi:hypothetical protein
MQPEISTDEAGKFFYIYSVVLLEAYEPSQTIKNFLSKESAETCKNDFEKSQEHAQENYEKRVQREEDLYEKAVQEVLGISAKEYLAGPFEKYSMKDREKIDEICNNFYDTDEEYIKLNEQ